MESYYSTILELFQSIIRKKELSIRAIHNSERATNGDKELKHRAVLYEVNEALNLIKQHGIDGLEHDHWELIVAEINIRIKKCIGHTIEKKRLYFVKN